MNIALLLTGHYRTFDLTYPSWKSLFVDKYNADVYMSIWDNIGLRTDLLPGEISPTKGAQANAQFSSDLVDINKIKTEYGIQNLIVEPYFEIEAKEKFRERIQPVKQALNDRGIGDRRLMWFLSQYYKRKNGIEWISKQDKKYDLVFVSRPDFQLNYYPNGSRFISQNTDINFDNLDKNKLHMASVGDNVGYHDFFVVGSPYQLQSLLKIYDDYEVLFEYLKRSNLDLMSCGHGSITTYVNKIRNLEVEEIGMPGYIRRQD